MQSLFIELLKYFTYTPSLFPVWMAKQKCLKNMSHTPIHTHLHRGMEREIAENTCNQRGWQLTYLCGQAIVTCLP